MIRKLFALALMFATLCSPMLAQVATVQNELGFAYAVDYSKWAFQSAASISTGAQTVIIRFDAFAATPSGRVFYPLATNAPLLIDVESAANVETVTPSAVTCTQNSLQSTCSFTATFSNAHTGNFSIRSGTFGICEAKNDIANTPGVTGGTIVVANGFGGTTTTITTTAACAAAGFNLLDVRTGAFQFYAPSATAFVASLAPLNTTTTPAATVTSAVGAPFFYTGAFTQTLNGGLATIANNANTSGAKIDLMKTRAATAAGPATTTIVTADDLAVINAWGADGTNYINSAAIEFQSTGTIGATRVPSKIVFKTGTDAAPTVLTAALTLGADQSAAFAGAATVTGLTTPTGGVGPSTATSGTAGFATTWADTGMPAAGTTGTNTTGIANQLWYTQIYVPYNITATNVGILCGGTCTTDKIAIGIWKTDGQTLLRATAATVGAGTVLSGANTWQKIALTTPIALDGPARYIIGVVTNGTTAGDFQAYPLASGPVCAVASGMGTLATAFTPATTGTASSCPYAFID